MERANCNPIEELISKAQMRWVVQVVRMQKNRLTKCMLCSEPERGEFV